MSRARENVDKLRDGDFTGIDMEADSISLVNGLSAPTATIDALRLQNADDPDPLKLDWYQEGSWTPTYFFSGVNNTPTYLEQVGRFVRIGRLCYLSGFVSISSTNSSTGNVLIAGIPFNASSRGVGSAHWNGITVAGTIVPYLNTFVSPSRIGLFDNSGTNSVDLTVGDLLPPCVLAFSITYEVAV